MVWLIGELAESHRRRWAGNMVDAPDRLARRVTELMLELRLAEWTRGSGWVDPTSKDTNAAFPVNSPGECSAFNLLPAAARFLPAPMPDASQLPAQEALW